MIVGAAVCPGAPFLIEGTADAVASRLKPVALACGEAVAGLPSADVALVITSSHSAPPAGHGRRLLPPGTLIATESLRRSDLRDRRVLRLAGGALVSPAAVDEPTVGTMVGAFLLAASPLGAVEHGRPDPITTDDLHSAVAHSPATPVRETMVLEVEGDPTGAAHELLARVDPALRVALLVIADGSACHGDAAPGRRDDRADPYDAALAGALASGNPSALRAATADRELARGLLANVDPLAVLAELTACRAPDGAELLYSAAPMGVGYLVASWRWAQS